jgi:hypothetical protein
MNTTVYDALGGDVASPRAIKIENILANHPLVCAYSHWEYRVELEGEIAYFVFAAPDAPACEGHFDATLSVQRITQGITDAILEYLVILKNEGYYVSPVAIA